MLMLRSQTLPDGPKGSEYMPMELGSSSPPADPILTHGYATDPNEEHEPAAQDGNAADLVPDDGGLRFGQGHSTGTGASSEPTLFSLQMTLVRWSHSLPTRTHSLHAPPQKPEQIVLLPEGGPRCTYCSASLLEACPWRRHELLVSCVMSCAHAEDAHHGHACAHSSLPLTWLGCAPQSPTRTRPRPRSPLPRSSVPTDRAPTHPMR